MAWLVFTKNPADEMREFSAFTEFSAFAACSKKSLNA
jgi:hypothetical protein